MPTPGEIDSFLENVDVVVAFETPYDWNIFMRARQPGIKTVLIPMYEWTPPNDKIPSYPDLFLYPSRLDYDELPEPKQYIPTVPSQKTAIPGRSNGSGMPFRRLREIDVHVISASTVAQKIDEVAMMQEHEIALLSQAVSQLADERSWSVLRPKFIETLNNLIKSEGRVGESS